MNFVFGWLSAGSQLYVHIETLIHFKQYTIWNYYNQLVLHILDNPHFDLHASTFYFISLLK